MKPAAWCPSRSFPRLVVFVALTLITNRPAPVAADATGKWLFDLGPYEEFVDVTQTGSDLSFTFLTLAFSGTRATDGRFTANASAACPAFMRGVISPDDRSLSTTIALDFTAPCGVPDVGVLQGYRCGCLDGNSDDGDGCDSHCQVEPCFTCVGEPSVCTPTPDGGACNDDRVCTTGETCSAGVCGGGSPVAPPCVDLNGVWLQHLDGIFGSFVGYRSFFQRGSYLASGAHVGQIDPATGTFRLFEVASDVFSLICPENEISGVAALDGKSMSGSLTEFVGLTFCSAVDFTMSATRCGGGTLDPDEQCDDGNDVSGDGCSASCAIEQCYGCSGEPSACAPVMDGTTCDDGEQCTDGACSGGACVSAAPVLDGTPCDDGVTCTEGECAAGACVPGPPVVDGTPCDDSDECTSGDTCMSGTCTAGAPATGTPCDDGDPCTEDDVCTAGTCTAGPAVVCPECQICGPTGSCVAGPPEPCDDHNACTIGDSCFLGLGHCASGAPVDCGPCLTCNPSSGCEAAPQAICREPAKPQRALLIVNNQNIDRRDGILWKWRPGDMTAVELGAPWFATTYALCVYDDSAAEPSLLFRAVAEPGVVCDGCWEVKGDRGYTYRDPDTGGDGLVKLQLGASPTPGRAKLIAKGKGTALSGRPYELPTSPIPLPLRVQVQGRNGACFQSRFTQASVSGGGKFKARGTGGP